MTDFTAQGDDESYPQTLTVWPQQTSTSVSPGSDCDQSHATDHVAYHSITGPGTSTFTDEFTLSFAGTYEVCLSDDVWGLEAAVVLSAKPRTQKVNCAQLRRELMALDQSLSDAVPAVNQILNQLNRAATSDIRRQLQVRLAVAREASHELFNEAAELRALFDANCPGARASATSATHGGGHARGDSHDPAPVSAGVTATSSRLMQSALFDVSGCEATGQAPQRLGAEAAFTLPTGWAVERFPADASFDRCSTASMQLYARKDTIRCRAIGAFAQAWDNRATHWTLRRFLRATGTHVLLSGRLRHMARLAGAWAEVRGASGKMVVGVYESADRHEFYTLVLTPEKAGCTGAKPQVSLATHLMTTFLVRFTGGPREAR